MAPRKKSASSASSSTSTSSTSGSDSSSDSTDTSSSLASVKDAKIEKTAQQSRRKSQEVSKTPSKVAEKKTTSSDDEVRKKASASQKKIHTKVNMTGAKVPPSVIKEMHNPLPKGTVKPSLGMKAAAQQKHKNKITPVKKITSSTSDSEEEKKPLTAPVKKVTNQPQKRRGRPPKNPQPVKVPTASSSSTESTDSEESASDSTGNSSSAEKDPKKDSTSKKDSKKQTRSSNAQRSKHLLGKTETDSDSDMRRSFSRSPKRLAKLMKKDIKPVIKVEPPEKRRCPLDECDSMGHLAGQQDRHFTIEACPMYHNITANDTRNLAIERKKQDEERKKALEQKSTKTPTPEQKLYGQKVRDARAKFKSPTPSSKDVIKPDLDREREPNLKNFVPDYDYQLFRQAQAAASESIENELKVLPASRGTKYITMGKNCMVVWYQSPYPEDVARLPKLYLCEFCLRYQKSAIGMKRHASKCVWRHPPGDEIYRRGKLGVWQIDGKRQKQYCQHLCLLAKFFLDHKTLYYDVEPFLFYVMTIADADGCHTIGYFSKEKNSFLNYNVSCILTLPPYQRKGYGRLLIDFSYLLTRVEGKIGSPEKPLSDLGLISYRSYWKDVLLNYLCSRSGNTLSIKDISQEMAINSYDIVSTLQALGMMKYWKGKHIILKKQDVLEEYSERLERRGNFPKIDQACLRWVPFVPPQPSTPS